METGLSPDRWAERLRRMTSCMEHRGPDAEGLWFDAKKGVGLGHRRLSIIDLSEAGGQPMVSASGRYRVAYNGEIYNFRKIREELKQRGCRFRGHSDTEVMLASFDEWGVAEALPRFNGMFAFALWDAKKRSVTLARDRLGIKPLYYGRIGGAFAFGSELKPFKALPEFEGAIDRNALTLYLRHSYVPAPHSIYEGVRKLEPGHLMTISVDEGKASCGEPVPYWSMKDVIDQGRRRRFEGTDEEAVAALDELLRKAVEKRMIADVPLGAFLSGGIDSSTIVALMQAQSHRPVHTFSIGFEEQAYNEATYAKEVAEHLGTDHTELYVTSQDALSVIPKLPKMYDEPFSDSSQIPTYLVSEMARQHVTVSLSGDGGDELFGGYTRYFQGGRIAKQIQRIPGPVQRVAARAIQTTSPETIERVFDFAKYVLPQAWRYDRIGGKLRKLADVMENEGRSFYYHLVSHWDQPATVVRNGREPKTILTAENGASGPADAVLQMMYLDTMTYLPDDILTKVDRASMGVSLETRVPLLDHRVVEFAWRLPLNMKVRQGQGKWVLRQVLSQYVPESFFDRPKQGFGVPIGAWLRGPLREWAEALLDESRLCREGYFNPDPIREKWREHLSGHAEWHPHLWDVLMFQAWLEEQ
jgi:asparagine synthase (glutamine-hydrolysing)